ncbi:MAG: ribonuclease P protein component [Burkholderiales bacterium]
MTTPKQVPPGPARTSPSRRAHRLTGQGAFDTVFRTGRRVEGVYLQLVVAPAATPHGRTGYVIARKVLARAVDRNRIRRKLRETVRAHRGALGAFDVIVRVKRAGNRAEQDAAALEAQRMLAALAAGA